jgi:Domain of unknown function DUF29
MTDGYETDFHRWAETQAGLLRTRSTNALDWDNRAESPPSWQRAEVHHPTEGAVCAVCSGQRWWSRDQLGWCCMSCHPPPPSADTLHTVDTGGPA